jgi:hypothetical protein
MLAVQRTARLRRNWPCEEEPMSTYVIVSALIFAVVAVGHASKYPPAEPGALIMGPLEAAVGVADAAPIV